MFDYNKLRGRIIEKYGTQKAFALKAGETVQSVSLKLNSGSGFSQTTLLHWCELLDIKTEDIGNFFYCLKV